MEYCWCSSIELSPGEVEFLEASYRDCLCPECIGTHKDNGKDGSFEAG